MGDIPPLTRFSERIKWLIQRNTRFGGTSVVQRWKVEEIGANLGMSKVAACEQFLSPRKSMGRVHQ
jgi:hypothetical protein